MKAVVHCQKHRGPYFKEPSKRFYAPNKAREVTAAANYAAPEQKKNNRQVTLRPEVVTEGNATKQEDVATRWCHKCKTKSHSAENCYVLHPEIKERRLEEIANKKKDRSAQRHAEFLARKAAPAEQSENQPRQDLAPARGTANRGRGKGRQPKQAGSSQATNNQQQTANAQIQAVAVQQQAPSSSSAGDFCRKDA